MPNIFNPALAAGCLMDLGVYCVYPALDFWGEPERIQTTASFLSTGADGWDSAIFSYPELEVSITCSKVGRAVWDPRFWATRAPWSSIPSPSSPVFG